MIQYVFVGNERNNHSTIFGSFIYKANVYDVTVIQ